LDEYRQAQQEPALQQVHDNKGERQSIIQKGVELGARESNDQSEGITQTLARFGGRVTNAFVKGRQSVGQMHREIEWRAPTPPSMPVSTETETGLLNDRAADKAAESEREADGQEEVEA
jgi:hypothetical protein